MTSKPTGELPETSGSAPAVAPPPGGGSIRAPAIRGSIWTMGGYAGGQLLKLASNVILARLLFPAVFGQVALVYTFITGLSSSPTWGRDRPSCRIRAATTPGSSTRCGRSPASGGSCSGSRPGSSRYLWRPSTGSRMLAWLIPAAGFSSVIDGFTATSAHQVRRHMRFERITIMNLAESGPGVHRHHRPRLHHSIRLRTRRSSRRLGSCRWRPDGLVQLPRLQLHGAAPYPPPVRVRSGRGEFLREARPLDLPQHDALLPGRAHGSPRVRAR